MQGWLDAVGLHVSERGVAVVRPTYTAGGADLRICVCWGGGRGEGVQVQGGWGYMYGSGGTGTHVMLAPCDPCQRALSAL